MLKGKARNSCGNSSTVGASTRNMSINSTNQKAKVGAVQVIKTTTTRTPATVTTTAIAGRTATPKQTIPSETATTTTTANSKLIKKAHVRFDDYLDLNEENMRRSCKRLMNHLYSDSTTSDNNSSQNKATQNVAPVISHCRLQSQQQHSTNECPSNMQTGASIRSVQNSNLNRTLLRQQATPSQQQTAKTVTSSKGKSYLRSQYERRQLQQLELMQQETIITNKQIDVKGKRSEPNTDGAIIENKEEDEENEQRRQQQDLMAKSHELSKRRFFEKLERRESLKNLNLNINNITPIIKQKSKNTDVKLCKQSETIKELEEEGEEDGEDEEEGDYEVKAEAGKEDDQRAGIEQKKPIIESKNGCISNNIVKNADDELMLKAYQTILKGSTELKKDNNDTLGRLDGTTNLEESLTGELVVASYPSLGESTNACEHENGHERLIELSTNLQKFTSLLVAETSAESQVAASDADESAFEIRVTGTEGDFSADSLDQIDGFISSNLLVVKQVESTDFEGYQGRRDNESLDKTGAFTKANQWLSSSNGRIETTEISTQMISNKTKTPPLIVNCTKNNDSSSTSNKVILDSSEKEQISNSSGIEKGTCASSDLIVSAKKSMPIKSPIMKPELSTPPLVSETPIDGDNQQPAASVSSTISSKNNCNEMKTISSLEAIARDEEEEDREEVGSKTTGIVERVGELPRKSDKNKYFNSGSSSTGNEQVESAIKASESNCAKNHELPETVMFVGQSGGVGEKRVSLGELNTELKSSCTNQIGSAAQVQQVVNLQTEITKLTIRDVLPEASRMNRKEIVNFVGSEDGDADADPQAELEGGKVREFSDCCTKVVNGDEHKEQRAADEHSFGKEQDGCVVEELEGQVEALETNGYANLKAKQNEMQENNTSIDAEEAKVNPFGCRNNGESMMRENNQLIKSFNNNVHTKLVQKQSSSVQSTAEEDNGSSCSSSGFGASASSSDGSASIKGTDSVVEVGIKQRDCTDSRRPNSLAIKTRDDHREPTCNPLYDSVRFQRNSVRMQHSSDEFEFPDYKRLVGPDQGYPSKSSNRTFVIENHNYASIVNRCKFEQSRASYEHQNQSISLERDDFVGYANLPRKKIPPVEYATVRPISSNSKNNSKLKDSSSEISLSAQSYSTTSANSGGFSALPPAQVEKYSPANNFDSLVSLNPDNSHRKSSIFKRFGSLVSKAFTGTGTGNGTCTITCTTTTTKTSKPILIQSTNSEINNDQQASEKIDCQKEKSANQNTDAALNGKSKLALVIEQDHHKVGSSGQAKVEEADLVILPAKHVNQRKHQQQEQNLTIRRDDDDRLSRGKKQHSRKMKKTDSSTSFDTSSTTSSSASSSSHSTSTQTSNHFRHHHKHNGHLRKADSLSEDLESLMSRSDQSNGYKKQKKNIKSISNKIGTLPNAKNKTIKSSLDRIEIDCIQPIKATDIRGLKSKQSGSRINQRPVLRLLNKTPSSARCTVESTPNLIKTQSREFRDSTPNGAHQEYRDNKSEDEDEVQQPISGLWGFSSLMNRSHAKISAKNAHPKGEWKSQSRIKNVENLINQEASIYGNMQPLAAGYKLHLSAVSSEERQIDKCQSLNLYQNLLRNYSKRRHRHHGHNHHSHNHHHHHHSRVHYSASRHAHHSARCGKNCLSSTNSEISNFNDEKAIVWGQLIKINKSDGSQVIELQRSPGRPWGFFVARGAINNTKGKLN